MNSGDSMKILTEYVCKAFLIICVLLVIVGMFKKVFDKHIDVPPSPVEEYMIDSIKIENTKLIIEVNNLDSIKNVKAVEVKSLDNDSTLKLFYELIRR